MNHYNLVNGELKMVDGPDDRGEERIICLFSCGVTSYVATKMMVEENRRRKNLPLHIIYTYVRNEPEDNLRFLADCERLFGQKVLILVNEKFGGDIYEVQRKTRYISGVAGARCTKELKWRMRKDFTTDFDIQVFGFNAGEEDRLDQFANSNGDIDVSAPLIDNRITKPMAIEIAENDGLLIPESYRMGYQNANCIGCVKGGAGYWNKIRVDYPMVFQKQAKVERELNAAINKRYEKAKWSNIDRLTDICKEDWLSKGRDEADFIPPNIGDNVRIRVFLDELNPNAGRYEPVTLPSCGVMCEQESGEHQLDLFAA